MKAKWRRMTRCGKRSARSNGENNGNQDTCGNIAVRSGMSRAGRGCGDVGGGARARIETAGRLAGGVSFVRGERERGAVDVEGRAGSLVGRRDRGTHFVG